jgi:hypothetical protein
MADGIGATSAATANTRLPIMPGLSPTAPRVPLQ